MLVVQTSDLRLYWFGAGEGNRTPDLLITNEPLCRLSYPGLGRIAYRSCADVVRWLSCDSISTQAGSQAWKTDP